VKISTQKSKKYERTRQHDYSEVNNSTVTNTNDSEMDEIADKELNKWL
jgi:hypothetical protein